ncbi:mechanosensitive ion channel family protein [Crocinitomix catalasitica]|uniref:mechanosensitive ion channel family protein n=1 Tax=Crocinitomix catalasitica TaxID=184607 RepID=UPI00048969D7|nr:mechanosensitive ion channel domain-containing protein [Crocinitomix catalasitica]
MNKIKTFLSTWLSDETVNRMAIMLVAILLVYVVLFFVKKAIAKHVEDPNFTYRTKKVSNIFAYVFILIIILFVFSDKLGNIGVTVGLASAGIAFALSEVITSFAGWLSIMVTKQVKVGQRVKIGDLKGDIIDIQVLKTTIMEIGDWVNGDLYNGRITTLSNSFVFKEPIQNYSADYPFLWDEIEVPLRTNSDFKLAKELFKNITNEVCGEFAEKSSQVWQEMHGKYKIENAQVEPMITMRFDENWITFTIRFIVDYTKRRSTKDILYTRLLEEINKNDDLLMIATSSLEITTYSGEQKDEK